LRSSNSCRKSGRAAAGLRTAAWAVAVGLCLLPPALAIDPDRAISQYVRDEWGTEQGFPKGPVYGITQTADGYLWIASGAGLVRFDGWNFRLIRDETGEFTMGSALGVEADNNGCLWLRLQDLSLVRYCAGRFDRPTQSEQQYIRIEAMNRTRQGDLLVWRAEDGAYTIRAGNFIKVASALKLPPSPVLALAQTRNGDLWMGTRDAGLFRESRGQSTSIRQGLPDLKINCLLSSGGQNLWVGTDDGIVRWDGDQLVAAGPTASLHNFQVLAMIQDRDGNVWVGTDSRGVLRFNAHGAAAWDTNGTGWPRAVTALFEDREGNVWIGHADGIERLRDSAFITYSLPEGLPTDGSNPVFVDADKRVWFPPVSGGLWWLKDELHGQVRAGGLDRDVVYSIAGGAGELWLGRQRGGLTELRSNAGTWIARTYTHRDGLAQDSVYSLYRAQDGTVWAGTLSAGASRLRNGEFTNFTVNDGLASNTVASILETADGTTWFATPTGLSAFSGGRWTTFGTRDGLPSDNVNCMIQDSAGVLWAGTAEGLAFRIAGGFRAAVSASSLRAQILGMAEDRYGSLWIATSNSVIRANRKRLFEGTLDEGDVRQYGLADGLRGVEGVRRQQSVVADSEGRIWLSLNRGISVVDPARLTRNSAPVIVHVQTIQTDNEDIGISGSVRIPGGSQRIRFGYSGLNLSVPDRVRYRYRLDGFDRGWSETTAAREAVYTNLPPGDYRFRVVATNPDGLWGTEEGAVSFAVEPLLWQTWWFRAGALLFCVLGIVAVYQLRLRQLTAGINSRFQERLAERTRIAQELHDTLLQGFLSASMQVHVAADRLPENSTVKPALDRALELMRQVIDEGRNAVRGLRASQSASLDLERAFARIPQELAEGQQDLGHVDFRVIVDGEHRPLHPVLRDEVYRIGREALLNAFRHARAKRIEMELKYTDDLFSVSVRDDGCGIDPAVVQAGRDGHWGLSGMRERADRIGAGLHVLTSATAGTEIELSIPARIAFQDVRERRRGWFGPGRAKPDDGQP